MEKNYRVVITAIDAETKEETVEVDDVYTGLTLLADCGEGKMAEIVLHDNLANMAAKLAAGSKTSKAVRLATLMMEMANDKAESAETALLRAIMGGIDNE